MNTRTTTFLQQNHLDAAVTTATEEHGILEPHHREPSAIRFQADSELVLGIV